MIGYGPPGSLGQLPTDPHDDEERRRAAEEYRKRRRVRMARAIALVVLAALVVAYFATRRAAQDSGGSPAVSQTAVPLPAAADFRHAWVVGDNGSIVATTDGGRHWLPQTSGTSYILSGVTFADNEHGWAVGFANGNEKAPAPVLSTTDGGAHWARRTIADHFLPVSVACVDATHAWVAGEGSSEGPLIAATSDGGAHWTTQLRWSEDVQQIEVLAFADSLHGWAIAGYDTLLTTGDAGVHWTKQALPKGYKSIDCISCPDASHCFVGGSCTRGSDVLYPWLGATEDGGTTWHSLPVAPIGSDPLGALAVLSRRRMLVGSYDHAWSSMDHCAHLTRLAMPAFTSFAFVDSRRGWCVAGHDVWATADGGRTWRRQYHGMLTTFPQAVACGAPQAGAGPTEPN
jgi:photosystem II stability/assembly factor-like uncharacterized protein